jgi:glycine/D-amino acid oxidase-like deaminating enzyme/nitrite reductase/ring-hydroxylating ferredoxin subunit
MTTSRSIWRRRPRPSYATELADQTVVDVCVVGAGMAGLSVAYELSRQGARVAVVDQGVVGGGETGRTSAHLTNALDDRFYALERRHGTDVARLAGASHAVAIDLIENNVRTLGIDCDFQRVNGYLFAAPGRPIDELDRELEAAVRAQVDVEPVACAPLPFGTGAALRFPRQARFEPLAYLDGLAKAVVSQGNTIHTDAHAIGVEKGTRANVHVVLEGSRSVHATVVVDATNAAFTSNVRIPLRQAAYRTYVITVELTAEGVPDALYWDSGDPYHYLRVARDTDGRDLLLVGGEDHRVGQDAHPSDRWNALERWIRERMIVGEVVDRWSGQIMEPADGLAFVGKSPDADDVYVVSGDSGHGLTHAVIASVVIPELIAGHEHPWAALYEPKRSMLKAASTVVRDAAAATVQYADWLGGGDVDDIDAIPRGSGAVVRRGVHLIAVYRDDRGNLHECSARCPHMSAVVAWNEAEKTWDCPAHGSRFDGCGKVLHVPALSDLGPAPVHTPASGTTPATVELSPDGPLPLGVAPMRTTT